MHRIVPLVLCALGLATLSVSSPARAAGEVVAEPNVVRPGQTVKLRWYFTGAKVLVSGGRFGKGVVVTGRTSITDTPHKTTRYTFDVYYKGEASTSSGETAVKPEHAHYTVLAEVDTSPPVKMINYKDPHGWKIDYFAGWERDVDIPDTGTKGVIYFQKEYDSVERMAVAVMPANSMSLDDLRQRVLADVPERYTDLKVDPQTTCTVGDSEAQLMTLSGMDVTHPGTRTASEVLIVIHDGRAYVVSVRTSASRFAERKHALEKMIKSFGFSAGKTADKNAPYLKHVLLRPYDQA